MTALALGQGTPNVKQESTQSTCTNIVALTGNVDIKCSNLSPAQAKALADIPGILKMLISNQKFLDSVMEKFDQISKAQCPPNTGNTVIGAEASGLSTVGIEDQNEHDCIVAPKYGGTGTGVLMRPPPDKTSPDGNQADSESSHKVNFLIQEAPLAALGFPKVNSGR